MTPTEHTLSNPSSVTGRFAVLRVFPRGRGSVAPSVPRSLIPAALLTIAAVLAFTAAAAQAKTVHVFSGSFTGSGASALSEPAGVAVNGETGDVYVVDKGNKRVEEFNSTGTTVLAELAPTGGFSNPEAIAVDNSANPLTDPSAGDVYVIDIGNNVIDKFSSTGTFLGSISKGAGGAAFSGLLGVAVDPTGTVWVYAGALEAEDGEIDSFSDALVNAFESTRKPGVEGFVQPGFAVDSEDDLYVMHRLSFKVAKLNGAGALLTPPGEELGGEGKTAIAVEPSDDSVYLDNGTSVSEFAANGTPIETFGAEHGSEHLTAGAGLAVASSSHTVYVADRAGNDVAIFDQVVLPDVSTGEASDLETEGSATLNGTVNPNGVPVTSCQFEYVQAAKYEPEASNPYEAGAVTPCSSHPGSGPSAVPVSANVTGLTPDTLYHYRLLAANANDASEPNPGEDRTFIALASPNIEETFVTNVASSSATLQAKLNPGGTDTSYTFEYAPAGGAFAPVGEPEGTGSVPAGTAPVPLSVHVQHGLAPGSSYEFRLVAGNQVKSVTGEPVSFTTQPSGGEFALPDGRQWEMVTPPQKQGTLFEPTIPVTGVGSAGNAIQASAGGSAIADVATAPTEPEPQGNSGPKLSVLSTRGPAGWSSQMITPPHPEAGPVAAQGGEYEVFSQDLSRGVVQPLGNFAALSPEATESTAYLHTDYFNGNVNEHCEASYKTSASCFQPLVTAANTLKGGFGELDASGECFRTTCGPAFVAGTPDLSHVIVSSPVQLTSTPIATEAEPEPNLYEWSGGQLQLLSIMPESTEGAARFILAGQESEGGARRGVAARHAISDDGGRIVMETVKNGSERLGLYLRDASKHDTVRLDVPQGEGTEPSVTPQYMTASRDDSRIFFLDDGHLTPNSGAKSLEGEIPAKSDLYECAISEEAGTGKDRCNLTDLTPKTGGESAGVATLLGASEDGSYVYFAAAGNLALGAQPGGCPRNGASEPVAAGTTCNVYVRHEGMTMFLARLSQQDARDWAKEASNPSDQPVRVSSDGRWLAFMSNRALTGYDTRDAASGRPDQEVYLYDATSNKLACASCDPTGARPVGFEAGLGSDEWVASLVPGWTAAGPHAFTYYQSRYLSDSGRLFFDSKDALVPRDVNSAQDVYEYEPEGVPEGEHACTGATHSASVVFKPAHSFEVEGPSGEEPGGCVGLISSGTSHEESTFLDASQTGGDVFFLTTSTLAPQDSDTARDVYDAHECTAASPCLPAPAAQTSPCDTEASCKAAPTPQPDIFGAPASGTLSGTGNIAPPPPGKAKAKSVPQIRAEKLAKALKACKKKPKKKRPRCERQARKSYGASKAKKATNKRKAKR